MNPETVKAIQEALAPMAQKLGEGAAHLYEIYVRQMFAEAVAGLVTTVLVGIILWVIVKFLSQEVIGEYSKEKKSRISAWSESSDGMVWALIAPIFFVGSILIIANVTTSTMKAINPEYYAIERILDTVKGNN